MRWPWHRHRCHKGNGRREARKHLADLKAQQAEVDRLAGKLEARRDAFRQAFEEAMAGDD